MLSHHLSLGVEDVIGAEDVDVNFTLPLELQPNECALLFCDVHLPFG